MTRSRLFKLALPAVVALGAGTAVAIAAIPSTSDGVIHGLLPDDAPRRPGQLRVIDVATTPAQSMRRHRGDADLEPDRPAPARRATPARPATAAVAPARTPPAAAASAAAAPHRSTPSQAGGPSADIFLALDGIPGDSDDAKHKNEIAIESFAFLAKRPRPRTPASDEASPRCGWTRSTTCRRPGSSRRPRAGASIKSAVVTFSTGSDTGGHRRPHLQAQRRHGDELRAGRGEPGHQAARLAGGGDRAQRRPGCRSSEKRFGANGNAGPAVTSSWQVPEGVQALEVAAAAEHERAQDARRGRGRATIHGSSSGPASCEPPSGPSWTIAPVTPGMSWTSRRSASR